MFLWKSTVDDILVGNVSIGSLLKWQTTDKWYIYMFMVATAADGGSRLSAKSQKKFLDDFPHVSLPDAPEILLEIISDCFSNFRSASEGTL